MKKKSILGRVAVVTMALTLATTSMMSGTLARYMTSKNYTAEAIIAKWTPTVGLSSTTSVDTTTTTIDLAATIKSGGSYSDLAANVSKVGKSSSELRIAPGTGGYVDFVVDVTGAEVPTVCSVLISKETGYTIPEHLTMKLTNTGGSKTYGKELKSTYNSENSDYTDFFGSSSQIYLVGSAGDNDSSNKGIRFQSLRENTNAVQKETFRLSWEWPLDDDNVGSYDDGDEYNTFDTDLANYSTTEKKFGFKLSINLKQQGNEADTFFDTVVAG